jgi:hypothetical protein
MADHPSECPVCNADDFCAHQEQRHYQHETRVHSASFETYHVSTTFHVRCNQCGNHWNYTVPAGVGGMRDACHLFPGELVGRQS